MGPAPRDGRRAPAEPARSAAATLPRPKLSDLDPLPSDARLAAVRLRARPADGPAGGRGGGRHGADLGDELVLQLRELGGRDLQLVGRASHRYLAHLDDAGGAELDA